MKRDKRHFEDRLIDILPCRPGDTVYIVDVVDCKSGECPDAGLSICQHSKDEAAAEDIITCKERHPIVREVKVSEISASLFFVPEKEECGVMVIINDEFIFTPDALDQIKKTEDGAMALLREI